MNPLTRTRLMDQLGSLIDATESLIELLLEVLIVFRLLLGEFFNNKLSNNSVILSLRSGLVQKQFIPAVSAFVLSSLKEFAVNAIIGILIPFIRIIRVAS